MKENHTMRTYKFLATISAFVAVLYMLFQFIGMTVEITGNEAMFFMCLILAYLYWSWYEIEKIKNNRR